MKLIEKEVYLMLISIASPRKGIGQTITAINLSIDFSKTLKDKTLLIDINRLYPHVQQYLSAATIKRGLDDFYIYAEGGLMDKDKFVSSVMNIHKYIDIMCPNFSSEYDVKMSKMLLNFAKELYRAVFVDTVSQRDFLTNEFLRESDYVICIIDQNQLTSELLKEWKYKEKTIVVINKYVEYTNKVKINRSINKIEKELLSEGFKHKVFVLQYDAEIINECNEKRALNYILSHGKKPIYLRQLETIVSYILDQYKLKEKFEVSHMKKNILNKLSNLKLG